MIDSQHEYLFALANDLIDSRNKYYAGVNVAKLHNYCQEHFSHEERVMRQGNYPALREHIAMHDMLMAKLNAISESVSNDQWSKDALLQFMNEWLLGHILAEDSKLAKFVKKKGKGFWRYRAWPFRSPHEFFWRREFGRPSSPLKATGEVMNMDQGILAIRKLVFELTPTERE